MSTAITGEQREGGSLNELPMHLIILHAGPVQMALFPQDGSVRYLHAGEHEILRGISAPVRDETWATIRPEISELEVQQGADSFRATFVAHCRNSAVDFRWRGTLTGSADGTLVFDFDGEALQSFLRNRIGFCVLHPATLSGRACAVEHVDGSKEEGHFPSSIVTGAPFGMVRTLSHHVAESLEARVTMEGDSFEMEDQRNWTDASYKTFCTPLALARPVKVEKGTRIHQRITVKLTGRMMPAPADFSPPWQPPAEARITIGSALPHLLPTLGVIWNDPRSPTDAVIDGLRALHLNHLRVNLQLNDLAHADLLRSAAAAAARLGAALELAVYVDDQAKAQLEQLTAVLSQLSPAPQVARWLVYHEARDATPPDSVIAAREVLARGPLGGPIGGGAADNFTELNYNPQVATVADFTVHACNPQVHAFDDASIIDTLPLQGITVENARRLSDGRPVVISPVTLTRRWRANETSGPIGVQASQLPFQSDERQSSAFLRAWTLGSLASLTRAGVASVTYFEATGDNGVIGADGRAYPVCEMFSALGSFSHAVVVECQSSHPQHVVALAVTKEGQRSLLVANLDGGSQRVQVTGSWGNRTLELPAYGFKVLSFS